jgi:hypothetical protein
MSWIKIIPPEEVTGTLKDIHQRITRPGEKPDNILQLQSLQHHTLRAIWRAIKMYCITAKTAFRHGSWNRLVLLTPEPGALQEEDIIKLQNAQITGREIHETNQVAAYFSYANPTAPGLAVTIEGDELGMSPGKKDDRDNWKHH